MGAREISLKFCNSCEILNLFSGALIPNCLLVSLQITNNLYRISITLEKCKKECNRVLIFRGQGFCPLKINITQFPDGFRLNTHYE